MAFFNNSVQITLSKCPLPRFQVRRSLKIRGRRKEKEKLPSGITADYSAEFFAALNADNGSSVELDRGNEEIVASVTTTIESRHNGGGSTVHSISETMSPHSNASDNLKVDIC